MRKFNTNTNTNTRKTRSPIPIPIPGIDKSLALERKIESRKRNFSLDLENLIVSISLSTLDFQKWQDKILFLLSIFESVKTKFSFHSRFSLSIFESSNREFNIIRLSLVAFQLWRVLEQLAPEFFL